jgi:hypothetical protein
MGECVYYDSGEGGGDQYIDPGYYRRRLRSTKSIQP